MTEIIMLLKLILIVTIPIYIGYIEIKKIIAKRSNNSYYVFIMPDKSVAIEIIGLLLIILGDSLKNSDTIVFNIIVYVVATVWVLYSMFERTLINNEFILSRFGKKLLKNELYYSIDEDTRIMNIYYDNEKYFKLKIPKNKFTDITELMKANYVQQGYRQLGKPPLNDQQE